MDTTQLINDPRAELTRRLQTAGAALAAVLLAVAVLLSMQDRTAIEPASTYTTNESTTYLEFAGTIRNDGSGWAVLDDTGHEPDDLLSVSHVTSTSLRVNHPMCAQVVVVIVTGDDAYAGASWDLNVGPSVGYGYFVLLGSTVDGPDTGTTRDTWNPKTDWAANSNIWIWGRCLVIPQ